MNVTELVPRRLLLASLAILLVIALSCGGGGDGDDDDDEAGLPREGTAQDEPLIEGFGVKSELVTKADFPVTLAFAPDGRLFYNERLAGNIRVINPDGDLLPEPFAHVDVATGDEWGLLGLAIDPDFESTHYVYVLFTSPAGEVARPTVMRFTDQNSVGVDATVILELPETFPGKNPWHVGGNIHFGPDDYLYVSVGDYTEGDLAQDLSAPQGKILRVSKEDGSAAPDNPFVDQSGADPRVFAYGFRNSFDFAFHPETGQIYATENGEANCDELNLVVRGENYGWPDSETTEVCQNPGAIEAIHYFTIFPSRGPGQFISTVAPTGVEVLNSDAYPLIPKGSLLVCEFNPGLMRHYFVEGVDKNVVVDGSVVIRDCRLDIAIGLDGLVYYSNMEEIRRLVPEEPSP